MSLGQAPPHGRRDSAPQARHAAPTRGTAHKPRRASDAKQETTARARRTLDVREARKTHRRGGEAEPAPASAAPVAAPALGAAPARGTGAPASAPGPCGPRGLVDAPARRGHRAGRGRWVSSRGVTTTRWPENGRSTSPFTARGVSLQRNHAAGPRFLAVARFSGGGWQGGPGRGGWIAAAAGRRRSEGRPRLRGLGGGRRLRRRAKVAGRLARGLSGRQGEPFRRNPAASASSRRRSHAKPRASLDAAVAPFFAPRFCPGGRLL